MNLSEHMVKQFTHIPSWDELVENSLSNVEKETSVKLQHLKNRNAPRIMGFGRKIVSGLFKDPAIHKFADISWPDLVEILASQMSENRKLRLSHEEGYQSAELKPYPKAVKFQIDRNFSQLPCTHVTVQKRCDKAAEYCDFNDPILLLGDDDMLSLGLCERGFKNVHVIDIDGKVLEIIRDLANENNFRILTYKQDLTAPLANKLPKDFKMVFFDPFYSHDGVDIFFNAARQLTQFNPEPVYFLSIHLMSLMRDGIDDLSLQLQKLDTEVVETLPNFNSYPVPKPIKFLVKLVNKAVIKDPVMRQEGSSFNLFTSDAIILQRKTQTLVNQ